MTFITCLLSLPYSNLFLTFGELFFQWQELLARKPKEGEEDPVLVEEIRKARENVGMYTRKTSFEYEELDPIRFEKHKTFLVQLLTKVQKIQPLKCKLPPLRFSFSRIFFRSEIAKNNSMKRLWP